MADTNTAGNWKKRESLPAALIQIVLVGLILFGAVFVLYRRTDTKKKIDEVHKEARAQAIKGNPSDLKKAVETIESGLAVDANAPALLSLGASVQTTLWLKHNEPGAEAKAKDLLEQAKKADAKGEDRYGTEALHLVAAGQAKEAVDFVENLFEQKASSAKLYYALGLAHRELGNLPLANVSLRQAMDKQWKDPAYPVELGQLIVEEGSTGAADVFTKGLTANPDHAASRLGMALVRIVKKDRVGDAEAMLKEVMGRDDLSAPLKARAMALGAHILNISEQYDQAAALADQAVGVYANDGWALLAKANALAAKKDPGAVAAYDAAISKNKNAPIFYFDGASRLQKAGQLEAALALLNKYETLFKDVKNATADGKQVAYLERDDKYWLARGDVLREAGKDDDAMVAYDKAIAAKSVNISKAYYAKGSLLVAKKEFDKAADILIDITPPDGTGTLPEAYMAMGDVHFAKKAWGEGCQSYAYALTRMKAMQAQREQLNSIVTDVEKRLKAAGQAPVAKVWLEEAKPLIQ